ncbi:MFS transporter [Brevibacterium sp.]|uniref:MFS transporter n=1 Tax=Brevibacterium sp. TaxID=1701 RepID=UPI0025BA117D|nr:MFS transporter [Brevibacterium sp.]
MSDFEGHRRGDPLTRRIEIGLLMAGLATFTLLYSTQAILPYFSRDYGITPSAAALSVSAATAGLGIGLIVAVPVSERIGRVRLIRASLTAAALVAFAVAFVPSWPLFLAARFVMGLVLAGLPATAAVYLKEEIHRDYATAATGVYIFGTTLGGLLGRVASALTIQLAESWGYAGTGVLSVSHLAMVVAALIGLVCAAACWVLLPESRGFVPQRDDLGQLLRKFGRAFRDPVLLCLYLIGGLGMGTFVGSFNVLGFRLEAAPYLLSVGVIGLIYFVYPVAGTGSVIAGRLAGRFSLRSVMPYAPLVALAGIAVMALPQLAWIVVGIAVLSVGFFMMHALASAWVAQRASVSVGVPAQAMSMYMLFYYAGSSVNGNLAPLAWELDGWRGVSLLSGALMAVAFALSLVLARSRPLR